MRRLLATLALLLVGLLGLPATGQASATSTAAADPLGGGAVLFNPTGAAVQCTAAFAAVDGDGDWYLITGRACGTVRGVLLYSTDSTGSTTLVGTAVSAEPAYAVVRVTNTVDWELVPWIATGFGRVVIEGSRETPVGGSVCLIDRPVAFPCGTVMAKDETITLPSGKVGGLTRTNICASDRAVAYVSGNEAQGVPMGGSSFCTTPGASWFAPVNPILRAEELRLLTG